jgi:hypothetical protein
MSNEIAFGRTTEPIGLPAFIVDRSTVSRDTGRQIDWDQLGPEYFSDPQRITLTGNAAAGAVTIAVEALPVDLEVGDALEFGTVEQVTVTAGATLVNATTLVVTALPGPVPSGTVLWFGTNKFAHTTADAAAGATSIAVTAIPVAMAGGETATFEGGTKVAIVDAHADAGATSVTVEDLPLPLTSGDIATVPGGIGPLVSRGKSLPAGTSMDLLASGLVVPSALGTGGVTAYGLLATNAHEGAREDAATGYGMILGGVIYENLLPEATGSPAVINSTWKTELLARGNIWQFLQYSDNT